MCEADEFKIEGLAAQLYVGDRPGNFVWWHLLHDEIKVAYRKKARKQIADFERDNAVTWAPNTTSPPKEPGA